jgi:hypothetical protein
MNNAKVQGLTLQHKPYQTDEITLAELKTQSAFINSTVLEIYEKKIENAPFDIQSTLTALEISVSKVKSGDLSNIEEMLFNQAIALESIFAMTVQRANDCKYMANYQAQMQIALKAQNQSRATLQALVQLKQPSQTTFVKQANIAQGHQQVNNLPEKNITPQNELLRSENAKLDSGGTAAPERVNTALEALDKVNRAKDTRRQEKVVTERTQDWRKP